MTTKKRKPGRPKNPPFQPVPKRPRTVHLSDIRETHSPLEAALAAAVWCRETSGRKTLKGRPKPDVAMLAIAEAIDKLARAYTARP